MKIIKKKTKLLNCTSTNKLRPTCVVTQFARPTSVQILLLEFIHDVDRIRTGELTWSLQ